MTLDVRDRADIWEVSVVGHLRHEATQRAIADGGLEADIIDADGDESDDWDPEPASLREGETPDETSHAARNAPMLAEADRVLDGPEEELPPLHIGDHVHDRDDGEGDDSATMLVVGLDTHQADDYGLGNGGPTVADVNPDYPSDDDVVEVVFPSRTDVDVGTKRYAYPRERLELETPIHDR